MARAIATRLKRLETRNRPPVRVRNTVVEYEAETGVVMGPPRIKGTKVMMVPHFKDWPAALLAQQEKLVADAFKSEEGMAQRTHLLVENTTSNTGTTFRWCPA